MKVNGRSLERVDRNIASCDAKIKIQTGRLLVALAERNPEKVKSFSMELRRLRELQERWVAERIQHMFPNLGEVAYG